MYKDPLTFTKPRRFDSPKSPKLYSMKPLGNDYSFRARKDVLVISNRGPWCLIIFSGEDRIFKYSWAY